MAGQQLERERVPPGTEERHGEPGGVPHPAGQQHGVEDQGLAPNTSYTYRVRGYGPGGFSGYSNQATITLEP